MVHLIPGILGIGCAIALYLACERAKLVALMLLSVWAGAITLWFYDALWLLPLLDLAVGVVAICLWLGDGANWSLSIAVITTHRLLAHVFDWFTHSAFFVGYAHALNVLFALQLIIIASTGGADGRRRFVSWLRRLRSLGGLGPSRSPGMTRVWK